MAARLRDLEFGTYFPAGRSSLEFSRRRSRLAAPLAVQKGDGMRPARTGTPGCRAGMLSLRSDQPRAPTVYCVVATVRTTTIRCYDWR